MNNKKSSWVDVPANSDFTIYNIPFGIVEYPDGSIGAASAIGNHVLNLQAVYKAGYFDDLMLPQNLFNQRTLNRFIGLGKSKSSQVRDRIIELLDISQSKPETEKLIKTGLVPMDQVLHLLPVEVPNYTDFYSSLEHATNVGTMFRDPSKALLPNWRHLPVGYHGRSSSIVVSGTPVIRPKGQTKPPDVDNPVFGPSKRLDFELEMAFITNSRTSPGDIITTKEAEEYIFGMVLFNDWSARDIQVWEYVPLGPFLAKNFASSVSPWIVTIEALDPFRIHGPVQEPEVLPYLQYIGNKNFNIDLEVGISPENREENIITQSNFKYMYWNMCQQLAHHTINGCNIEVGDMYASGTISGPTPGSYGSLLELAWKATKPLQLSDGTSRSFIHDGDTITMRGHAGSNKMRVGFGEVTGKILPAK